MVQRSLQSRSDPSPGEGHSAAAVRRLSPGKAPLRRHFERILEVGSQDSKTC
jgi:hypothetical protein